MRRCNIFKSAGIILVSIFFIGFFPAIGHAAFSTMGISPSVLDAGELLNDVPHEITVIIARHDSSTDMWVEVEVTGAETNFIQGDSEFMFKAGESDHSYSFIVLPKDAPTGRYNALIEFLPFDIDEVFGGGTAGTVFRRGVALNLGYEVSDKQLVEFTIKKFAVLPTEVDLPIVIQYTVENTGNVTWKPGQIVFTIIDAGSGNVVLSQTIEGEDLEEVLGGATRVVTQELVALSQTGNYILNADFYYNNDIIYSFSEDFEVLPAGTLKQYGEIDALTANKSEFEVGETISLSTTFTNKGEIPVVARLIIEVYSSDGTLVDTLVGSSVSVGINEEAIMRETTRLSESGEYTFIGYVEYGNKVSGTARTTLTVKSPYNKFLITAISISVIIILIAIILLILILQLRKGKTLSPATAILPPQVPVVPPPSTFVSTSPQASTDASQQTPTESLPQPSGTPPQADIKQNDVSESIASGEVEKVTQIPGEQSSTTEAEKGNPEEDDLWTISL